MQNWRETAVRLNADDLSIKKHDAGVAHTCVGAQIKAAILLTAGSPWFPCWLSFVAMENEKKRLSKKENQIIARLEWNHIYSLNHYLFIIYTHCQWMVTGFIFYDLHHWLLECNHTFSKQYDLMDFIFTIHTMGDISFLCRVLIPLSLCYFSGFLISSHSLKA